MITLKIPTLMGLKRKREEHEGGRNDDGKAGNISKPTARAVKQEPVVASIANMDREETRRLLRAKQQENADLRKERLAEYQLSSFLTRHLLRDNSLETRDLLRSMAAAKPPQELHDISGHCAWTVLPPWIPAAKTPPRRDLPESEFEIVLKIHTLLSQAEITVEDLSTILALISKLVSILPNSTFHPIAASFPTLWSLAQHADVPDIGTYERGTDMLCLAIYELWRMARARFGEVVSHSGVLDKHALVTLVRSENHCPTGMFSNAVFQSADLIGDQGLATAMGDSLGVKLRLNSISSATPSDWRFPHCFYHKNGRGSGLLVQERHNQVLLIDFENRTVLLADKFFCLVKRSAANSRLLDLRIRGPREEDEVRWIRNAPLDICSYLIDRAEVKLSGVDD
jgi:hypothetical protein